MKLLKADPDKVTVEIAPGEILLLVAAVAEGSPPSGLDAEANELFHSLLDIHRATLEAEERAGPPFSVGEEVLVSLKIVGTAKPSRSSPRIRRTTPAITHGALSAVRTGKSWTCRSSRCDGGTKASSDFRSSPGDPAVSVEYVW